MRTVFMDGFKVTPGACSECGASDKWRSVVGGGLVYCENHPRFEAVKPTHGESRSIWPVFDRVRAEWAETCGSPEAQAARVAELNAADRKATETRITRAMETRADYEIGPMA